MITQALNHMIGKRVRITGETFVEKGILLDFAVNMDSPHLRTWHFMAWLKTENGERCVNFKDIRDLSLDVEPPESSMTKLSTIQKRANLHQVYRADEPGAGGFGSTGR